MGFDLVMCQCSGLCNDGWGGDATCYGEVDNFDASPHCNWFDG